MEIAAERHLEDLLAVLAEAIARGVGDNLVVQGGADEPLGIGVDCHGGDGV